LPAEYLIDAGYTEADWVAGSRASLGVEVGRQVRDQAAYQALVRARAQQGTLDWQSRYHQRAGIEGTISQGVRVADLRHARYLGLQKVHLQHIAAVVVLNLIRLVSWLNEVPRAKARRSRFAALALAA